MIFSFPQFKELQTCAAISLSFPSSALIKLQKRRLCWGPSVSMCLLLWWSHLTGKPIKTDLLTDRFSRGPFEHRMRSTHMWKMTFIQYGKVGQVETFHLSIQRNASALFMGLKNGVSERLEPLLCLVFWLVNFTGRSSGGETFTSVSWIWIQHFCAYYTGISSFLEARLELSVEFGRYESTL